MPRKILITGVSGLIGDALWNYFSKMTSEYDVFGLDMTREPSKHSRRNYSTPIPDDKFICADISKLDSLLPVINGFDTVIHLAGNARPIADWNSILNPNIIGAYNMFEACRISGVKRVISASTIRVVEGYFHKEEPYKFIWEGKFEQLPEKIPLIDHNTPVRPIEIYGASKVFGESLARVYSENFDMSFICIRIGLFSKEKPKTDVGIWCASEDMCQLVELSIKASPSLKYDIFFGVSESPYRCVDIEHAREVIGYIPKHKY